MIPATAASKTWQDGLIAIVLIGVGLLLGRGAFSCFDDIGPWWRGRVQDRFMETQARVDNAWSTLLKAKHFTVGTTIMIQAHYQVEGLTHSFVGQFAQGRSYDKARMAERAAELARTRPLLPIFYDPQHPSYAVLNKDDIPGFFKVVFMGTLGGIIEITALGMIGIGLSFFGALLQRPAKAAVDAKPSEPSAAPLLTGDPKADYYSGALASHALGTWEGYWCSIYLMPDKRVIVVHDEAKFHRVATWTLEEAISGKAEIPFDDNQEQERESFEKRLKELLHRS